MISKYGCPTSTVTGLLDRRFVLGLLLPVLAFWAGVGGLVATACGWSRVNSWWQHLDTSRHVALILATVAGLVFMATVLGTQVVPMTRILEGYWSWSWVDKTIGRLRRYRQAKRRTQLHKDTSPMGYLREYQAFAPAELGPVMPTRLGNALRAAESYPGYDERWGLDAVFWWPRLYLIVPDSTRDHVDEARASMDQLILLSLVSATFAVVAIGFGSAGLTPAVWVSCAAGGLILARLSYLAAVASAAVFGDLVRSCFDLFHGDLLTHLGWQTPESLPDERTLWRALGQQLYRRSASSADQGLVDAPRPHPEPPSGGPHAAVSWPATTSQGNAAALSTSGTRGPARHPQTARRRRPPAEDGNARRRHRRIPAQRHSPRPRRTRQRPTPPIPSQNPVITYRANCNETKDAVGQDTLRPGIHC